MIPSVFVVDTCVLASGLITRDPRSPVTKLVDAMLSGGLLFLLSPALLDEYREVLLRPRLGKLHRLGEHEIDELLAELVGNAIWCEPTPADERAPDPGDDHLWALLASREGSTLITGDHLLLEHPPEWASVISPRSYLERISHSARGQV